MDALAWGCIGIAGLAVLWQGVGWFLRRVGLVRANYRGVGIPVGFGLVTVLWSSAALLMAPRAVGLPGRVAWPYLAAVAGFGGLGFVDDLWGDRSATGLRGHLRALVLERRVTTGLVKAVGGLLLAAALGAWIGEGGPAAAGLRCLTIALSANAVNLLDLRPGRAGAAFLALAAVMAAGLLAAGRGTYVWPLALVALPAFAVYLADRRARVMMGDTGSNALGAALGLSLAISAPLGCLAAATALLLALHLYAERGSLSRAIEARPILRALDRLTGER